MSEQNKKQEEQRLHVTEEKVEEAVEDAMKNAEEEGVGDVNVYKCGSAAV
ncbi:MAG: hypothetical protein WCC10_11340 [Tumebacillaceae bacterium]